MAWTEWLVVGGVALGAIIGIVLTLLTLPGIWFAIVVAGLAQWWSWANGDPMFSWWTLGTAAVLAVLAELAEFGASAVGAAKAGGSKRGAAASVIGGFVGALLGTIVIPIPIAGTILGAAILAGTAALLVERHHIGKTWDEATKVGTGAAVGRLVSTIIKAGFATVVAVVLIIGAVR